MHIWIEVDSLTSTGNTFGTAGGSDYGRVAIYYTSISGTLPDIDAATFFSELAGFYTTLATAGLYMELPIALVDPPLATLMVLDYNYYLDNYVDLTVSMILPGTGEFQDDGTALLRNYGKLTLQSASNTGVYSQYIRNYEWQTPLNVDRSSRLCWLRYFRRSCSKRQLSPNVQLPRFIQK